jgi:hypothetical protein
METDMRLSTARSKASANGEDALHALRRKAEKIGAAALPRAASAAESAGKTISDFALSSSRSLARSLHHRDANAIASGAFLQHAAPLLRTAARIARRHPLLLASAGVAIALIGYSALRSPSVPVAPTP